MGLKPEIRQYLSERSALGLPAVWQAPLDEIRKNTNLHIALSQPLIDLFEVKKILIPGPKSDLPVRIYRPSQKLNLPALVFFHGGGWVLNFLDIYEPALRKLALAGDFVIIAVEYQKAPEHPYPAAFNDCFATLEWVVKNAMSLGIDPKAIGVGGDSHSVPAFYKDYPGQIHGFFNLSGVTADAELLYSDISREINSLLGRDK